MRLLQDLNLRGNLPIHFECITLTTRSNSRFETLSYSLGLNCKYTLCKMIYKGILRYNDSAFRAIIVFVKIEKSFTIYGLL